MKHFHLSQRKVDKALGIFNKAVKEILKANAILEEGVQKTKKKFDDTCDQITHLEQQLDEHGAAILEHEAEIKKNVKLIAKFQEFIK
jgi:plasmid maintenance system antidote protein VapI